MSTYLQNKQITKLKDMTAKLLIGLHCWLFTMTMLCAQNPRFYQAVAQDGDGVYALLRRYGLEQEGCDLKQFYQLNDLKRKASLSKGKPYYLPILIYDYNGKSIRSTIGNDDWDQAVRIRDYNRTLEAEGIRAMAYEKDKFLWVPLHELDCVLPAALLFNDISTDGVLEEEEDVVEVTSTVTDLKESTRTTDLEGKDLSSTPVGNRTFPIFGKQYAYTPLTSDRLAGKVFYIVGGHGGPDPGAVGYRANHRLCEDEYAYDIALRLCRNLVAHGATAYMITRDPNDGIRSGKFLKCDTDETLWGGVRMSRRHKERLFQRSDIMNELYKKNKWKGVTEQKIVIFHVDSRDRSESVDLFFYHFPEDEEGKKLAENIQKVMKRQYKKYRKGGNYSGTVTERDLHMLRETTASGVYIELGNIGHERDQQRIVVEQNRQLIADWVFEGLLK